MNSIWDRLRNYADDIHSDYNIHHVGLEWLREAAERGAALEEDKQAGLSAVVKLRLKLTKAEKRIAELEALLREAQEWVPNDTKLYDRVQEALKGT